MNGIHILNKNDKINYQLNQFDKESNIKLFDYQLMTVKKMLEIENKKIDEIDYYKYNNKIKNIKLVSGILGNLFGTGKSYIILELIKQQRDSINNLPNIPKINNNLCYNNEYIVEEYKYISSNIILTPHILYNQWIEYLKTYNIKYILIDTVKSINKFFDKLTDDTNNNDNYLQNYFYSDTNYNIVTEEVILVKNTMYIIFQNLCSNLNLKFSRLIIDESDSITFKKRIEDVQLVKTNFIWWITGNYLKILQHNYKINIMNKFFMNIDKNIISKCIVVCNKNYILKQIRLNNKKNINNIKEIVYKYRSSIICDIFEEIYSKHVLDLIDSGAYNSVCEILDININNSTNIINNTLNKLKLDYDNLSLENTFENRIKQIKIKNKIESIELKIKEKMCIICYNISEKYIISICCNNYYCLECFLNYIKHNFKNCANCRLSLENTINIYRNNNILLTQIKTVIEIIKNLIIDKNSKIIICSNYIDSYFEIIDYLILNEISHSHVNGRSSHISKVIDKFNNGLIKILFLNSNYSANGLNITQATDMIIFSNLNKYKKNQLYGRVIRLKNDNLQRIINIHLLEKE